MTSCKIVFNFSPPDRSMQFVTPSGPGNLSSVSLCISSITSFLSMGESNSGTIGWVGLAISWAILVADDWMERASFSLYGDSFCETYGGPRHIEICTTLGGQTSGARGSISVSLWLSWFALGVSI